MHDSAVLDEALARGASLIVSYHPSIFSPLKALALANPLQSTLLHCTATGIHIGLQPAHGAG
ncbi:hypothetical protein C8J57DRAFT_1363084 [Mycena rebaudengoi]|nr:hypothetical protein C8J57DRAFT_1363084 [Mycena rebaudengoi]